MGVDFRTKVFRGWIMTIEQKKRFNELTCYEYEDYFTRPNFYDEPNDTYNPIFFGDTIETLDTCEYVDVQAYHDDGLHPGLVFVEDGVCDKSSILFLTLNALTAIDIARIFLEPPKIYIINQVS